MGCGMTDSTLMRWIELKTAQQLEEIKKESETSPVLIFKHSTRCSTSRMSLDRLERNWSELESKGVKAYFLDLLSHRNLSNLIVDVFGVEHESPQAILVVKGKPVLDLSHFQIDAREIRAAC
jgi:bacillithiol system protein YtxJ